MAEKLKDIKETASDAIKEMLRSISRLVDKLKHYYGVKEKWRHPRG